MISLAHQFLSWCRSKPADEEYDPGNPRKCALAQFGIIALSHNCEEQGIPLPIYHAAICNDNEEPTFGSLADRVERQLAEQGQVS